MRSIVYIVGPSVPSLPFQPFDLLALTLLFCMYRPNVYESHVKGYRVSKERDRCLLRAVCFLVLSIQVASYLGRDFAGGLSCLFLVVTPSYLQFDCKCSHTIRYDTRCYFIVRSKADISQLNLPHLTDN